MSTTSVNVTTTPPTIVTVNPATGVVTVDVILGGGTAGTGDVIGPASSTDNAIVRFNGTTGKLIQNSGITIADGASGTLSGTNSGDQNLFQTIAVAGQSDIVADTTADTLTIAAGTGIALTTNAGTDTLTITATGTDTGITQLTGDVTAGPGNGSQVATLASTAVTPGSYTHASLTVDSKGRLTAASSGSVTSGTVTSVSVTTANGVSGTVATPTTTPAISITLGAITPSSVAASGNVTGANLSGTNTGDQTNITGNAGTATKLATARTIAITGDLAYTSPAFDGSANVTAAGTLASTAVTPGSYTAADITVDAKGRITAAANGVGGSGITALTGDVTATGPGSAAATIANSAVTLTKIALAVGNAKVLGSGTFGSGNHYVELDLGSNLSMSGTTLNAADTGITQLTGDVTAGPGSGSQAATLADTAVTPGSYTSTNITVDSKGRITAAANGSAGAGDMTKAVYDPQNLGFISGEAGGGGGGGVGGYLKMVGGSTPSAETGGYIDTSAGDSGVSRGGNIDTRGLPGAGSAPGGDIITRGGSVFGGGLGSAGGAIITKGSDTTGSTSGGSINTSADTLSGGSINTSDGGGSISTRGTGSIELGESGTRTTVTGTATADRAVEFPDKDGTLAIDVDDVEAASSIVPVADGTYSFFNDGITSGQVTSITTAKGIITSISVI